MRGDYARNKASIIHWNSASSAVLQGNHEELLPWLCVLCVHVFYIDLEKYSIFLNKDWIKNEFL